MSEEEIVKIKNEMLNMASLIELISQPSEEEGAEETSTTVTVSEVDDD